MTADSKDTDHAPESHFPVQSGNLQRFIQTSGKNLSRKISILNLTILLTKVQQMTSQI